MTASLSDLLTPVDRDEVIATLLAIAASLDAPTTSWQEGDPTLTQIMTVAQKVADLSLVAIDITKGGFGDLLPSDAWADLWAKSRFNVDRIPAQEATGVVTFTCGPTAAANTYQPREIIIAHATTGKTYRNAAAVTLGPSTTLPNQAIEADEPGTGSNAAPTAITVMVSSLVGVTVSNPASVLGVDKETTSQLVRRARAKLGALSPNGPKDAYNYVATTPSLSPGLTTPITRTRTVTDEDTGEVSVFLATAAGAPVAGDVTIVQASIDALSEPWGATATAIAATEVVQNITYQSWVRGSNLSAAQIESAQSTALAFYLSQLNLGGDVIPPDTGSLYVETLEQIISIAVAGTVRVVVSVPSGTVAVDPSEVVVLGTVTPTTTLL